MRTHTTKYGNALPHGRVTRRSREVGKPKGVKPLPFHLQCHPQRAAPIPRNPGCVTSAPITGGMIAATFFAPLLLQAGRFLNTEPGPVTIEVVGHGTWYANDSAYAFGWAKAARQHGLTVNVYINDKLGRL